MATATEGKYAGEFLASEARGSRSREEVTVVTGQNLEAGMVVGKITASSKYKVYDPAAVDGSQTVAGVLYDNCDASAADKKAVIIARDAEVNDAELSWFAGATAGQITTGIAGLAALGIIARKGI